MRALARLAAARSFARMTTSEMAIDTFSGLRRLGIALSGAALVLALPATSQGVTDRDRPGQLALRASRLIDIEQGTVITDAVVLVEGPRIVAVGTREQVKVPEGARLLDLGSRWLLPGLVDAHVHLAWSGTAGPSGEDDPPPGAADALATLRAGFTTVRNLGSTGFADLLLRDAIEAGRVPGPRMLVAGPGLGARGGTCARVFANEGVV